MDSKWEEYKVNGYAGHRRLMHAGRFHVNGSVSFDESDHVYRWMAYSSAGLETGWSRSLRGAQRACSRKMWAMKRKLEETAK
jgi:hypothetical protein